MSSYYTSNIQEFLRENEHAIMGKLAIQHRHDLEPQQRGAWAEQIALLKQELQDHNGFIFFEFTIPRMGKRADCIIICGSTVFVLEFKIGADSFDKDAIDQAHDYALDLKDFHRGSHELQIIPILIATNAHTIRSDVNYAGDYVAHPVCLGRTGIGSFIHKHSKSDNRPTIDPIKWSQSGYAPTPTIIEAARSLYENKKVAEIMRSGADAKNLDQTTGRISAIIDDCKINKKKAICFVTGVPGAGKTLAGLNIATQRQNNHQDDNAVFLSGNGPLVDVLREALARDSAKRTGKKKSESERQVSAFVQNIHHFRDENFEASRPPHEHVAIFDEAQRAWDQKQVENFMKRKRSIDAFGRSESKFLIEVMDRHQDWCVIVCLIGGGQEINKGEAGISEWIRAIIEFFPHWEVHASPSIAQDKYLGKNAALTDFINSPRVVKDESLHLSTSIRSFRARKLSNFIAEVLEGNIAEAVKLRDETPNYPIFITRDLNSAKDWLRKRSRGTRRCGMIASSGAARLQPEGIYVNCSPDPKAWFLNDKNDVRSSNYLELTATEFHVQGLELDWACVCWDADFRHTEGKWIHYNFKGTKWTHMHSATEKSYLLNAYRVLLTRAREGLIIFVPKGNDDDHTTLREYYDGTWNHLIACGITQLT